MPIAGDSGIDPKQLDKFYASKSKVEDVSQKVAMIDGIAKSNSNNLNEVADRLNMLEHAN